MRLCATAFLALSILPALANAALNFYTHKLSWIVGKWRSEFSGKVFWPTVPTMTYGEELLIAEAPRAHTTSSQFLNFSARAWSHSTKDHFHDEWGFLTVEPSGNVTLMTVGNNGFTTYEVGEVQNNKLVLTLKDIGRISFSRDLPVEDVSLAKRDLRNSKDSRVSAEADIHKTRRQLHGADSGDEDGNPSEKGLSRAHQGDLCKAGNVIMLFEMFVLRTLTYLINNLKNP